MKYTDEPAGLSDSDFFTTVISQTMEAINYDQICNSVTTLFVTTKPDICYYEIYQHLQYI